MARIGKTRASRDGFNWVDMSRRGLWGRFISILDMTPSRGSLGRPAGDAPGQATLPGLLDGGTV